MRAGLIIIVVAVGCNAHNPEAKPTPGGSDKAHIPPRPVELHPVQVHVSGGRFRGRDRRCFEGTTRKKRTWPGDIPDTRIPLEVGAFTIDRDAASCEDLEVCVQAGACPRAEVSCHEGLVEAPLEVATAFCAWRHGRLPTYLEWQRAARGVDGWFFPDSLNGTDAYFASAGETKVFVSPEGMRYAIWRAPPEWTSDHDCVLEIPPEPYLAPVAVDLGYPYLTERNLFIHAARFRCVSRDATEAGSGR